MQRRDPFGYIFPASAEVSAIHRLPQPHEQVVIDEYRDAYKKAMRREPHGLHFLPFPGESELVPVWLPLEED